MSSVQLRQQYATIAPPPQKRLDGDHCELILRQEPIRARVSLGKDKERKPVDPPPVVQIKVDPRFDPDQSFLRNPSTFMMCSLIGPDDDVVPANYAASLAGSLVCSMHRLKYTDNHEGGFYVWGDLSVKIEGNFRFRFCLYEIYGEDVYYIKDIMTKPFPVYSAKNFPGNPETTFLTRSFGDQGIKVRVRKEHRNVLRKRGVVPQPQQNDYRSQPYTTRKAGSNQARTKQNNIRNPSSSALSMECHADQGGTIYDSRPHLERSFSSNSSPSYSCSTSFEDPSKGLRTTADSLQIPTYMHHNQPTAYQPRPYIDTAQGNFLPYHPHPATNFGYTCDPSLYHSGIPRDHYFPQHIDPGEPSPYDYPVHRSPTSAYFPNQSPYPAGLASNLPRIDSTQSTYENMGMSTRGQQSPTSVPSLGDMGPPMFTRINPGVGYMNVPISPLTPTDRRDYCQEVMYSSPDRYHNVSCIVEPDHCEGL